MLPYLQQFLNYGHVKLLLTMIAAGLLSGCHADQKSGKKTQSRKPNRIHSLIEGGSMVPTLFGEHYELACESCRYRWKFDVEHRPENLKAVCPNCGWHENRFSEADFRQAETVDVLPGQNSSVLKRWDIVAIQHPQRPGEYAVKRVIGLPGESIRIESGDVRVDDVMLQKNLAEQRQMSITVYDADFTPGADGPIRWTRADGSALTPHDGRIELSDKWIHYQNIQGYRGRGSPRDPRHLEDFYGFNQTTVRALNQVRDIAIEFTVANLDDKLSIRFDHLTQPLTVTLDGSLSDPQVQINEKAAGTFRKPELATIYCSIYDQQILVAINNEEVVRQPFELQLAYAPVISPVSLSGRNIAVARIKIHRDIMWLGYKNQSGAWETSGDGYLLLGDNVPVSRDSRDWVRPHVAASEIVGMIERNK